MTNTTEVLQEKTVNTKGNGKRVMLVCSGLIPYPGLQGSTVVTWSVMKAYEKAGYHVEVCILRRGTKYDGDELLGKLRETGTTFHVLEMKAQKLKDDYLHIGDDYEEVVFADSLQSLCRERNIDALLLYTARCAAATAKPGKWPYRICFTVDLDHIARISRLNFELKYAAGKKRFLRYFPRLLKFRRLKQAHVKVLKMCEQVVTHAYNHTLWLKERGVNVEYLPLPVYDSGRTIASRRMSEGPVAAKGKLKLAMIGTPAGIATLSGYPGFIDNIIPALDKVIGKGNYEVHIIGNFRGLPAKIESKLRAEPSVIIRGYVDDLDDEFYTIDAILVPTPLELGFRTRIAEAFSYASCVIAHKSNKAGMPELVHKENVLLADTWSDFAHCAALIRDKAEIKHRIGLTARRTFEEHYDAEVVCGKMMQMAQSRK